MSEHLTKSVFFFKKWYFDAQSDDGLFLFAYFAPMMLFGSESAELVVAAYPPGGGELRRSFHIKSGRLDLAPDHAGASFGAGSLSVDDGGARFSFAVGDASLALEYSTLAPAWVPQPFPDGEAGTLLALGKKSLRWIVPVPHARVTGTLSIGGTEWTICGFGYHDFVQTDIPPWRLPLRELLWGRALGEQSALIWNRPVFHTGGRRRPVELGWSMNAAGEIATYSRLSARFTVEKEHAPTAGRYPDTLELEMGDGGGSRLDVQVTNTKLLLGERVADVQKFRGGLERWLYRRFTGDPVEYKLLSLAGARGMEPAMAAAHEWILWGRR